MPKVKVGDINMYYETHGRGDPLVLIPGHGTDCTTAYFRQIPGLAKDYRVIAIDNRGSGLSDKPDMSYTMEMMAKDAAGLLAALDVHRAHVCGHSMGGMIAQHLALNYPQMTASLILVCTTCSTTEHSVPPDQAVLATLFDTQGTPEERIRRLIPLAFTQEFFKNEPAVIERFAGLHLKHCPPPFIVARHGEAMMMHNVYVRLPQISVPALVIGAAEDKVIPVENSRILASRIPGAESIILERVGHMVTVELAEAVNKAILDFLRRHPMKQIR
jgi:pimeloyl-ACP methyl ester carboxylesterase